MKLGFFNISETAGRRVVNFIVPNSRAPKLHKSSNWGIMIFPQSFGGWKYTNIIWVEPPAPSLEFFRDPKLMIYHESLYNSYITWVVVHPIYTPMTFSPSLFSGMATFLRGYSTTPQNVVTGLWMVQLHPDFTQIPGNGTERRPRKNIHRSCRRQTCRFASIQLQRGCFFSHIEWLGCVFPSL